VSENETTNTPRRHSSPTGDAIVASFKYRWARVQQKPIHPEELEDYQQQAERLLRQANDGEFHLSALRRAHLERIAVTPLARDHWFLETFGGHFYGDTTVAPEKLIAKFTEFAEQLREWLDDDLAPIEYHMNCCHVELQEFMDEVKWHDSNDAIWAVLQPRWKFLNEISRAMEQFVAALKKAWKMAGLEER
jgi:hypothetical protein